MCVESFGSWMKTFISLHCRPSPKETPFEYLQSKMEKDKRIHQVASLPRVTGSSLRNNSLNQPTDKSSLRKQVSSNSQLSIRPTKTVSQLQKSRQRSTLPKTSIQQPFQLRSQPLERPTSQPHKTSIQSVRSLEKIPKIPVIIPSSKPRSKPVSHFSFSPPLYKTVSRTTKVSTDTRTSLTTSVSKPSNQRSSSLCQIPKPQTNPSKPQLRSSIKESKSTKEDLKNPKVQSSPFAFSKSQPQAPQIRPRQNLQAENIDRKSKEFQKIQKVTRDKNPIVLNALNIKGRVNPKSVRNDMCVPHIPSATTACKGRETKLANPVTKYFLIKKPRSCISSKLDHSKNVELKLNLTTSLTNEVPTECTQVLNSTADVLVVVPQTELHIIENPDCPIEPETFIDKNSEEAPIEPFLQIPKPPFSENQTENPETQIDTNQCLSSTDQNNSPAPPTSISSDSHESSTGSEVDATIHTTLNDNSHPVESPAVPNSVKIDDADFDPNKIIINEMPPLLQMENSTNMDLNSDINPPLNSPVSIPTSPRSHSRHNFAFLLKLESLSEDSDEEENEEEGEYDCQDLKEDNDPQLESIPNEVNHLNQVLCREQICSKVTGADPNLSLEQLKLGQSPHLQLPCFKDELFFTHIQIPSQLTGQKGEEELVTSTGEVCQKVGKTLSKGHCGCGRSYDGDESFEKLVQSLQLPQWAKDCFGSTEEAGEVESTTTNEEEEETEDKTKCESEDSKTAALAKTLLNMYRIGRMRKTKDTNDGSFNGGTINADQDELEESSASESS